ncbi:MAG TPA: hypothetical protein VEB68_13030 [Croceibacterium sp.]|nr:hypothetical protein [Croceibacterium sp.]
MKPEATGARSASPGMTGVEAIHCAPLGIPLHVELGQGVDPATVRAACHGWEGPADHGLEPMRLRVTRDAGLSGVAEPSIGVDGHEVIVTGAGADGRASARTMLACCAVSDDFLAAPDRLRGEVLEPLVLFVLAHHDRTPLHASGLIAGDLAILTSGPSGAGKSSLALAADRFGWRVLSDDTVYLQRQPQLKVWGLPRAAHLLPDDCTSPGGVPRIRNGQVKHAVPFRTSAGMASAERATLCVLAPGSAVALEPLAPDEAVARLGRLEPGFDLFARESHEALALLAGKGAWLLTLSPQPAEAIALLAAHLPQLRATAAP